MTNEKTRNGESRRDFCLRLCAAAGQGLQTMEDMLCRLLTDAGYHLFSTREYMSRVRGGNNSTSIRVSTRPVRAWSERIDLLFVLAEGVRPNVLSRVTPETTVVADLARLEADAAKLRETGASLVDLPLAAKAKELGGAIYEATLVGGLVAGVLGLLPESADPLYEARFKVAEVAARNKEAFRRGHALGVELRDAHPRFALNPPSSASSARMLMSGNLSVAVGCAAAGCNFVSAYPMSPGTALFSFFSKNAGLFDCAVEQAEDEIAAINMAIGASYAGARTLVSTSGGGFALMGEGLSLAGITETPVVVHLAQRPGPATGMATRTEQADLNLALYAGHGDFPRALLAPGSAESAPEIAARAFATAAKFQTPVILLTDQHFLDSAYDLAPPDPEALPQPEGPVRTAAGYARYTLSDSPLSPRGVPGHGEGLVGFDSHEHTEDAHITEDFALRVRMNDKRMAKLERMRDEAMPPTVVGPRGAKTLVVCWGSLAEPLKEAFAVLDPDDAALVCCEQVYPLSREMDALMRSAERRIFVENNAAGQFARLVHLETGFAATDTVLKYDGQPFSVEELTGRLGELLGRHSQKGAGR